LEDIKLAIKAWITQRFEGGQATDKKAGIDDSFANSQSLDFRKSPSQMSVLPGTRRGDNGVVTDLVQNEVMTESGRIYALGSTGNVYTVSPTGVWSLFGNVPSGAYGISYRKDQDAIYITSSTVVSQIINVSTAPSLQGSFYNTSQSTYNNTSNTGFNVNSNQTGSTQTTAITTTYVEGSTVQLRYFQTDIQPTVQIGVYIVAKGTGDWTMTVHDGLANDLGTNTITNANLVSGAINYFNFTPIQMNVGPNNAQTYHFHVTSTVADGTISSSVANDMSTADMVLYADRLVSSTNGIHPMQTFQQFETIGNGRYLSVWEPLGEPTPSNAAWLRQKLSFPPGYEVCGLAVFNEYLVIATERVTTGDNTPQDGIIFYWDGLADTYNYFTKIPEGSPEGIHEYENVVYYVAGGNWYAITSVAATPSKIRRMPGSENVYTSSNAKTRLYPYAATTRYGIQLVGWPSTTTNTSIQYGVYSWGKVDYSFPNAFGYSYILSTGSQAKTDTNNLTIGMVKNFGNIMHISWRDGDAYGVDVIDASSTPAPYAFWESLIFDNGYVTKQKSAGYIDCSWLTIQDGVEIVLKYSINRGDWVYSGRFSNSNLYLGDTGYARFDIGTNTTESRFREIQIGVDIYCSTEVTSPPSIVSVGLVYDSNDNEQLQ
jgi:hypothetical protein